MSLTGQVEAGVEIKAPASMIHEYFSSKLPQLSKVCPEKILSVDLLKGEWGKAGSVIFFRFALEGKSDLTAKEIMEEIDYEKKKITYKVLEGLEQYKGICCFFEVTPKGEGSFVSWTLKYEKTNEKVPEPKSLLQLCIDITKDVDANLVPQA